MGLKMGAVEGQLDIAIDTALGTISCTMNPVDVAGQVLKAAQSLQEATIAAGMCEEICKDIQLTAINRLPVVCELLRLGQLFPDGKGVADLNQALLRCFKSVCDALHEARATMYEYLQCNKLNRLRQAASVEKMMGEKRWHLKNRFDDVNAYMGLAALLRSQQSAEQAHHTAAEVRGLQQQVQELESVRSADKARVMDLAQAAVARRSPKGQKVRVAKGEVNGVTLSPSGDTFVTSTTDGAAAVWDTATGTRMRDLKGVEHNWVGSAARCPAGSMVATTSGARPAAVWDAVSGACMYMLQGHSDKVRAVVWSPDGTRLATGSSDHTAVVWDAATGIRMHELRGHCDLVGSVAWSPNGSRLATGSRDHTAAVWDAATGARMHELRGHSDWIDAIAWSPDGSRLATGSRDSTAAVWDAVTGTQLHELWGHKDRVRSVVWSPHGIRVATASGDKTAAVWDVDTGTRIHELRGHSDWVRSVAWSLDACLVFTASWDGTVRIYSLVNRSG